MLLYRNGLLIEYNFVEVNGQNVVGFKVSKIIYKLKEKFCYLINVNKNFYCQYKYCFYDVGVVYVVFLF